MQRKEGVSLGTTSNGIFSVILRRVQSLSNSALPCTRGPQGYLQRLKVPSKAREATEGLGGSLPRSHSTYSPFLSAPPPPPASPPCNRVGVRGAMRNGQTPGDTAGFPLTPRGTHVYLEPGQMRTSLLLASFYPQTDKDGQGK